MAGSVRLSSGIFSHNLALKNKYLLLPLCSRYFCSKDGDGKAESSSVEDATSNEKPEKNAKETSATSKKSRFKIEVKPVSDETKESAKKKLMALLSEIEIAPESLAKTTTKLDIAKAVKRISKKERLQKMEEARMTPEKKMKMAVQAVSSNFKEDSEKVQSELTEKLSTLDLCSEVPPGETEVKKDEEVKVPKDSPLIDEKLSENLMSSVEEVADTISESPIPPRSELTNRLLRISLDQKSESKSMKSVIEGMVVKSQQPETPPISRERERKQVAFENRMAAEKRMPVPERRSRKLEKVDLFGGTPLGLFEPSSESKPDSSNTLWQKLQEKEVRLLTQYAPTNAFDEMIMWTEQGKHWKFPIDNETEMGIEEKTGFHEHVFLERHLTGFPTKGPIRHFMELVCVGLSKNPYITVERKIENIEWFRSYFKDKEEILRDAGAIE